jgi:hypothetical protein
LLNNILPPESFLTPVLNGPRTQVWGSHNRVAASASTDRISRKMNNREGSSNLNRANFCLLVSAGRNSTASNDERILRKANNGRQVNLPEGNR